jgi:hypothetical protein
MVVDHLITNDDIEGGKGLLMVRKNDGRSGIGFYLVYKYQINFSLSFFFYLSIFSSSSKRWKKEA